MPFAATWMDLEIFILSELNQSKTNSNDIAYTYNLKYNTNELIYKTKTDHGPRKQICGYQTGQRMGRDKLGIWD